MKYYNFPVGKAAVILTVVVASLLLFRLIQASVISTIKIINQAKIYTFTQPVLMNSESDNMGSVNYNFDPEYSVEEINSRQHLTIDKTA